MIIGKLTVTYGEDRNAAYQKCSHSLSMEVFLEEGETESDVVKKIRPMLRNAVTRYTRQEVERLAAEAAEINERFGFDPAGRGGRR